MGHPVLRRKADPVGDPTAPEIRVLVRDMVETMVDADGLGLAAPQVHVPLRVVVFRPPGDQGEASASLTILINPVVEPIGQDMDEAWEGCLSVPGLRGLVPRYARVAYSATSLAGEPLAAEVTGLHARVVQHECDHLDGILYPQRMKDLGQLIFSSEAKHYAEEREAEGGQS